MPTALTYVIELAKPADAHYVAQVWKMQHRWLGDYADMSHDEFFAYWNDRVATVAERGAACAVALSNHARDRFLYGFIVFEPHRLHYLFVRPSFRRNGVAKNLLALYTGPKVYVCETRMRRLARKKGWEKIDAPDLD